LDASAATCEPILHPIIDRVCQGYSRVTLRKRHPRLISVFGCSSMVQFDRKGSMKYNISDKY
jgi:hypothetical protein